MESFADSLRQEYSTEDVVEEDKHNKHVSKKRVD
jgi:hypothetical protein